ncbi:MAG TPA: tetratricopeptide repeat protein [Deltaproteobacteria bacterium]|nr:tetratricopeptide repeat protein [Deltaproteobacteria bacterium]
MISRALRIALAALLAAASLAAVILRYAEPVTDGDIWFHLAYGRYMLENTTLRPDHAAFSWTQADASPIYCAWIPQVLFFKIHEALGMPGLLALRYLFVCAFLALAALMAAPALRRKPGLSPLVILVCLTGLLMSQAGLLVKAELFSFLFTAFLSFLWFSSKTGGAWSRASILAIPLLVLAWVNSHGGFIFGVFFIACATGGEVLNALFRSPARLKADLVPTALVALGLSAAAILFTPYGWDYPAYLYETLFSETFSRHTASVRAYYSILAPEVRGTHYLEYLAAALVVTIGLVVAAARRRTLDWSTVTIGIGFALLFLRYMRTTYFFGVVFVFTAISLMRRITESAPAGGGHAGSRLTPSRAGKPLDTGGSGRIGPGVSSPAKKTGGVMPGDEGTARHAAYKTIAVQAAASLLVLFFSARMGVESLFSPQAGLNVLHFSDPAGEASFVRNNLEGLVMGNTYNCGSYLIWSLWPTHKVFIDERYFPYAGWYAEYNAFEYGPDDAYRHAFLQRYRCDFWVLSLDFPHMRFFLSSPDWRLVHYGPKAAVFLSSRLAPAGTGHTVSDTVYRTGFYNALAASDFATTVMDLDVASRILTGIEPSPFWPEQSRRLGESLERLGAAYAKAGRADNAVEVLRRATTLNPSSTRAHLFLGNALVLAGRPNDATEEYSTVLELDPGNEDARRSIAAIGALSGAQAGVRGHAGLDEDGFAALASSARRKARSGDYEGALKELECMLEIRPGDPETLYNVSCALARLGRLDEAMDRLEEAVSRGFDRWDLMKSDPDLASLRETDRYRSLVRGR